MNSKKFLNPHSSQLKKQMANAVILAVTLLAVIYGLEFFLRSRESRIETRERMYQVDSKLGWKFMPAKKGPVDILAGDPVVIETNAYGFRDTSFENPSQENIAVLGDSFVSNVKVPFQLVFTEVMEQSLKNRQVMNLGINGFSTVQEYFLLKEVLPKFHPSKVLLVIYIENDFSDNFDDGKWQNPRGRPYVTWENGKLIFHEMRPDSTDTSKTFKKWLPVHLYHFLSQKIKTLHYLLLRARGSKTEHGFTPIFTEPELLLKHPPQQIENEYQAMEEILKEMAALCQKAQVPLYLIAAPSKVQVDETGLQFLDDTHEKIKYDLEMSNRRLQEMAKRHSWKMLDLLPILREDFARGENLYDPAELHWNIAGNQRVAEALLKFIQ